MIDRLIPKGLTGLIGHPMDPPEAVKTTTIYIFEDKQLKFGM